MGVFVKQNGQWTLCKDIEEGGSTNDNLQALGYDHNQFYSYMNFNQPHDYGVDLDNIISVCLKVFTEEIICVITCPARKVLTDSEVRNYMQDFDFSMEYNLYSMESDLDSAIAEHNFSIQFVAEALGVPYSPNDKVLYSSRFKYNFLFENGYLVGYEIADDYNREAHELKDGRSWLYTSIESHALKYHGSNEKDAIQEINIQAKAFYNLPGGIKNEYLKGFKNPDGSYNFIMLLVAKYQGTEYEFFLNYDDCKCVCHQELKYEGRCGEGLDKHVKYRYRDYILTFDDKGKFISCDYGNQKADIQIDSANIIMSSDRVSRKESFLKNFFGVNIFNDPDEQWDYEGQFEGTGKGFYFIKSGLKDTFFRECKIIAFENGGANFLWQPVSYVEDAPYKIALIIERNLLGNENMTFEQCVEKYHERLSLSSIDIKDADYNISINYGFDKTELSMTLWTSINKDKVINLARDKYPDRIIKDKEKAGDLPKDQFLHNFFGVDLINSPEGKWKYYGFKDDENPHYIFVHENLDDEYFNTCVLLALVNGGCLYSWSDMPTENLEYFKIASKIHRCLLGDENFSIASSISKYTDVLLKGKDSIDIEYEEYKIKIRINSDGTYGMTLWTNIDKTGIINTLIR